MDRQPVAGQRRRTRTLGNAVRRAPPHRVQSPAAHGCRLRGRRPDPPRWRSAKYEADGGPGVREIASLVSRTVDRRDLASARADLARAVAFNWVAAGTDAHAKNFALLHVGSRTVLAPLYDLLSASLLWPPEQVRYKAKRAMKFGGTYRLRGTGTKHVTKAAADLDVDADWLQEVAANYAANLPDAVRDAVSHEADLIDDSVAGRFVDNLASRTADVARALATRGGSQRN